MNTPRTDAAWRKYYDESADEMDMKELMSALEVEAQELSTMLAKCADTLDEVRTGEDFECVCHEAADDARELLTRHKL